MVKESDMSKEMLKVAQETGETLVSEGMRRHQKDLALLKMLSEDTSKRRQNESKRSDAAGPEKQKEAIIGGGIEKSMPESWLMESLKESLPHLTEEEIIRFAGGLLG